MEEKKRIKVKVWKSIDKVIKASSVPKKLKWYEQEMTTIPKGEKASS